MLKVHCKAIAAYYYNFDYLFPDLRRPTLQGSRLYMICSKETLKDADFDFDDGELPADSDRQNEQNLIRGYKWNGNGLVNCQNM
jgi:hypothetical protein